MLPQSRRLRRLLVAYSVNELGTWFGYVALAVGVYDATGSALATAGLFVARGLLPALLAPLVVARVERSRRRGGLAALYLVEGALTLGMAALIWRFWLPGVLLLVALDGIAAIAATALVRAAAAETATAAHRHGGEPEAAAQLAASRSADPRAGEAAQRQANAALNVAFMFAFAIGPAIGGLLVHAIGGPLALVLDGISFIVCALLLRRIRSHVLGEEDSILARLKGAVEHLREMPALRTLLITEAVAVVFFSSVEPVEVVYAKATLSAGTLGLGVLLGVWGVGAAAGAVLFAKAAKRSLGSMLIAGTLLVGIGYLGFAAAPTLALASVAALLGGVGNGVQAPAMISSVQRMTPPRLQGQMMGAVGSISALCPAIGFALGGVIAETSSPRTAMLVAGGVATLATLAFVRLAAQGLGAREDPRGRDPEETKSAPALTP